MSSFPGNILLPANSVRRLGYGLMVAGLLLPFAVLIGRAANHQPPEILDEEAVTYRPEMILLPTGTFQMGSPDDEPDRGADETLHEVTLTRRFLLSRTEITQGQYVAVVGENPVESRTDSFGDRCADAGDGDDLPVVCVDWFEAVRFCNALSRLEGLEPAYAIQGEEVTWNQDALGYRLPTEAEWEYATRAGTRTVWVGTDRAEAVCAFANVADASAKAQNAGWATFECDDGFPGLAPVDTKLQNPWGLYGLGGNAAEWMWDQYGDYPRGAVEDPVFESPDASNRVIRGGSWRNLPRSARVANRLRGVPSIRGGNLGFRVARSYPLPSDP